LFTGVHEGEGGRHVGFGGQTCLLQVGEAAPVGGREDIDSDHIFVGARHEHVLGGLDDSVSLLKSHHGVLEVVIRVVQVDVDTPRELSARALVLLVVGITGDPDAVVGDYDLVLNGHGGLSPLEVEDVVRAIVPVGANVFCVVELLVDAAGLVDELSTGGPGGSQGPGALSGVEEELLDALA